MDLPRQLAEERRKRLQAERLLDQRQAELRAANRKLAEHARALSDQVARTREHADTLKGEVTQANATLARTAEAAAIAEQRLWQALQTMRDGFALFDADERLIIANKAYLSIFDGMECIEPGIHHAELTEILVDEGIVQLDRPRDDWLAMMRRRVTLDPIPPLTIRLWNGQFVRLMDRRLADGALVALGINTTDSTRMWAAIEAIPDGFVLYDQDDRLLMCNARYRALYPESAPSMVEGATFEDILRYGLARGQYAEAVGREGEWLEDRLTRHRLADSTVEQQLGDGRWLRILERATPDGGRVGLRVDVTSIKGQQEALDRERQRAEAASRAKSAFLANMSHEIRTPLNGVLGMADLLGRTDLSEEQRLFAETIKSSSEALLTILNDILDFSKIEAGKLTLRAAPFDLEATIHDVLLLFQPQAVDKALDLAIDYDMFLPTGFVGDVGRLRQVLTNLVGNAVKFAETGHVLIRVTGLDEGAQSRVHLVVEDTGIGIPPAMAEHVFGKFNQVEADHDRTHEGTGLGLAICRELVSLMGGEMWLESTPGEGSSFGFSVLLDRSDEAGGEPLRAPAALTRAIVIDRPAIPRAILEKQLGVLGLTVVTCDPGTAPPVGLGSRDVVFLGGGQVAPELIRALDRHAPAAVFVINRAADPVDPAVCDLPHACIPLHAPVRRQALWSALHRLSASRDPAVPHLQQAARANRLRILAAEDNRTNRLVLEKMLARLAVDLTLATDGTGAVTAFARTRPDLVLMDISMPGMDGCEATRRIRALEAENGWPRTPIVALTAHVTEDHAADFTAAGLDRHLTKPLKREDLEALILDCRSRSTAG